MTNDEMIAIIECWTVNFTIEMWEDLSGGVEITIKLGTRIAERIINYQTLDAAILESFDKTRHLVMAVCGDIERSRGGSE